MSSTYSDGSARPGIGGGDAIAERRDVLYRVLASNATPVVQFPTSVRSAASLWAGVREWTRMLRRVGVASGETIACASPVGETLLQLLLACLWDDVSLVLLDGAMADDVLIERAEASGARLLVTGPERSTSPDVAWHCKAGAGGWPTGETPPDPREVTTAGMPANSIPFVRCVDGETLPLQELIPGALAAGERLALRDGCVALWARVRGRHTLVCGVLAPLLYASELFVAGSLHEALGMAPDEPYTHLLVEQADAHEARQRFAGAHVSVLDAAG